VGTDLAAHGRPVRPRHGGGLKIGAIRWRKDALLARIMRVAEEKPRSVFVFDNVQTAPSIASWLSARLGKVPCIFLSWDADALPACPRIISVGPLDAVDSARLLSRFCDAGQASEAAAIQEICIHLEHHPLALSLVGRRLQLDRALTVADCLKDVRDPVAQGALSGPTLDRAYVVVDR